MEVMKINVIIELKKENLILRLVFVTVVFGMGLDVRCVIRIIYCRFFIIIEKYF